MVSTDETMRSQSAAISSIASHSPDIAWNLLTREQQQLILDYLATVFEKDKEVQPEQKERKLELAKA